MTDVKWRVHRVLNAEIPEHAPDMVKRLDVAWRVDTPDGHAAAFETWDEAIGSALWMLSHGLGFGNAA